MLWMTTYIGGSASSSRMLCRTAWLLPLLRSQGQAAWAPGVTQNTRLNALFGTRRLSLRKQAADLCTPGQPGLPKVTLRLNK